MRTSDRIALGLLVIALCAIAYFAPRDGSKRTQEPYTRLSTIPKDIVAEGEDLQIKYEHPQRAGETVTITIGNMESEPSHLRLHVDEDGVGRARFQVPEGWAIVALNAPDSGQIEVDVAAR